MDKARRVSALERILGRAFPVLDDGFVRLVDYMGSDSAIVQAARISYGAGTKRLHEDRGLIRYLMRHHHTTPFEMCEVKLHVRVPMDTWRQWIRHRTASVNEYSTRYSLAIDAAQRTPANAWRAQSESSKQGSEGTLSKAKGIRLSNSERRLHSIARETYAARIAAGVAREQARKDLPLSTYTEAYWKIDLHNLLHFLELRLAPSAQFEIRQFAEVIAKRIVEKWCPLAWEAFQDYRLDAEHFSKTERAVLSAIVRGKSKDARRIAADAGWIVDNQLPRNRERAEFESKLRDLGVSAPWA